MPETDKMVQFVGPETDSIRQFLAPEKVKMGQQNFWCQKLTKWFSFWGQKPYFMGEWNYISEKETFSIYLKKGGTQF